MFSLAASHIRWLAAGGRSAVSATLVWSPPTLDKEVLMEAPKLYGASLRLDKQKSLRPLKRVVLVSVGINWDHGSSRTSFDVKTDLKCK